MSTASSRGPSAEGPLVVVTLSAARYCWGVSSIEDLAWPSSEIARLAGSRIEFRRNILRIQENAVPARQPYPRWLSPLRSALSSSTKLFATAKFLSSSTSGRRGVARAGWRRRMLLKSRMTSQAEPLCLRSTPSGSRNSLRGTRSRVFRTSPYSRAAAFSFSKQAWWTRTR